MRYEKRVLFAARWCTDEADIPIFCLLLAGAKPTLLKLSSSASCTPNQIDL